MFGRKKMYKQGMADALHANEEFAKKQQSAIEYMRDEVRRGNQKIEDALERAIHSLDGCIVGLSQYLSTKEKAALYKLSSSMDIKDLEDSEKRLLVAVLYQLADDEGAALNDYQRRFIRNVQKYVGISNPQLQADLSVVSDIDSLEVQKAFLRVALEFLYLQDGDEISNSQEDFLNNFSVNTKHSGLIEEQVGHLYDIVGPDGIADKYGFDPDEFEKQGAAPKGPPHEELEKEWGAVESEMDKLVLSIPVFSTLAFHDIPDYESFGDEYKTQSGAKAAAERELHKFYDYVISVFDPYASGCIAVRAVDDITNRVENGFESLKKQICVFAKKTGSNLHMEKIDNILNYSVFLKTLKSLFADELKENGYKYTFESFGYYASRVEYSSDDCEIETGFLRLMEKWAARWDYSLCDAECELRDAFFQKQADFAKETSDIIKRELRSTVFPKIRAAIPESTPFASSGSNSEQSFKKDPTHNSDCAKGVSSFFKGVANAINTVTQGERNMQSGNGFEAEVSEIEKIDLRTYHIKVDVKRGKLHIGDMCFADNSDTLFTVSSMGIGLTGGGGVLVRQSAGPGTTTRIILKADKDCNFTGKYLYKQ